MLLPNQTFASHQTSNKNQVTLERFDPCIDECMPPIPVICASPSHRQRHSFMPNHDFDVCGYDGRQSVAASSWNTNHQRACIVRNDVQSEFVPSTLTINIPAKASSSDKIRNYTPSNVTIITNDTNSMPTTTSTTDDVVVSAVTASEVTVVTPSDVLFGRGKYQRAHEGNEAMRTLVHSVRSLYEKCLDRDDKTSITRYIVKTIQQSGGRFLKYDDDRRGWRVVSDEEARQKISHVMRDDPARKYRKSCTKTVSVSTSTMQHRARWQPYGKKISPASLKLSEEDADFLIGIFATTAKEC